MIQALESNHEYVESITTLRSGKVIDKVIPPKESESKGESPRVNDEERVGEEEREIERIGNEEKESEKKRENDLEVLAHAPFPHRLTKSKHELHHSDIYEMFKQVKINIPLLDAIKQIPSYAKFLKDLCTVKRKLNVKEKSFLANQASAILQFNTPPKYKDPGCPTITCTIGNHRIDQALLDLGQV